MKRIVHLLFLLTFLCASTTRIQGSVAEIFHVQPWDSIEVLTLRAFRALSPADGPPLTPESSIAETRERFREIAKDHLWPEGKNYLNYGAFQRYLAAYIHLMRHYYNARTEEHVFFHPTVKEYDLLPLVIGMPDVIPTINSAYRLFIQHLDNNDAEGLLKIYRDFVYSLQDSTVENSSAGEQVSGADLVKVIRYLLERILDKYESQNPRLVRQIRPNLDSFFCGPIFR